MQCNYTYPVSSESERETSSKSRTVPRLVPAFDPIDQIRTVDGGVDAHQIYGHYIFVDARIW